MSHELKPLVPDKVVDVGLGSGEKVVHTDYVVPIRQQPITEMAAKKTRAARDQNSFCRVVVAHGVPDFAQRLLAVADSCTRLLRVNDFSRNDNGSFNGDV